ncbi:MAG: serine/threonine protein kinase [Polyangiales bacterium]|jgi:serine/threonine protein kinase
MAAVYLARTVHARGVERIVAVKVIHDHLAKEEMFMDMFLDEATILSYFNHPNICTTLDFGDENGRPYIAMEYLSGESLSRFRRRIAKRRERDDMLALPSLAAHISAAAAEGLHHAHELLGRDGQPLDVVHRDVSPENIVVTFDGAVKLVDFGVAKAANRHHETQVAKIKGKFAYIAPEQLRSEPTDRRADVWGLGVCLWETLVLKRLFRRDNEAATLSAVLFDEIEAPSSVRPWVPASIDSIVLKALERAPEDRYASAGEMAQALREWAQRENRKVGSSELGDWMKRLFEEEHAQKIELIRDTRAGGFDAELDVDVSVDADASAASFSMHASEIVTVERSAPTLRFQREEDASLLPGDDELLSDIRGRRRWPFVLLALLIGAGLAIWFTPSLRQDVGVRLGITEPEQEPALIAPEPVLGELVLRLDEGTRAALFVGRSPALIEGMSPGEAVSFLVDDGEQRSFAHVPANAEWPALEGAPTYELGVVLDGAPSAEATAGSFAHGGDGRVRVITTPPGAKVFQVVGDGAEVRLVGLQRDRLMELLIYGAGQEDRREFVNEARWGEEPLLEIDLRAASE